MEERTKYNRAETGVHGSERVCRRGQRDIPACLMPARLLGTSAGGPKDLDEGLRVHPGSFGLPGVFIDKL